MEQQILKLIEQKNELEGRMQVAAEWLFKSCQSQKQIDAINDSYDSALAWFDTEISHLNKLIKMGVEL